MTVIFGGTIVEGGQVSHIWWGLRRRHQVDGWTRLWGIVARPRRPRSGGENACRDGVGASPLTEEYDRRRRRRELGSHAPDCRFSAGANHSTLLVHVSAAFA